MGNKKTALFAWIANVKLFITFAIMFTTPFSARSRLWRASPMCGKPGMSAGKIGGFADICSGNACRYEGVHI